MKTKWRGKTCKKTFLILLGLLMFVAACYAENVVKSDGGNPLLQNLRVTRTWAPTGNCISTLDAKWVEPEILAEARALTTTGQLTVLVISRDIMGWKKNEARVYGASDAEHAVSMWGRSEPIRDLIDLAMPIEGFITLEWWDTYSQYRILFAKETSDDIDKLASYINEMIAKDAMPKATSKKIKWTGEKISEWTHVGKANTSREWADGKGNTMAYPESILGPNWVAYLSALGGPRPLFIEYIKPSAGGPHRVVLDSQLYGNLNPFIYEADTYRAGSKLPIRGVSDRSGWWPKAIPTCPIWPDPDNETEYKVKTGT